MSQLTAGAFDALIVGGGINGAISAAALSAQGARVALIDQGDFAGATSQASSNFVWGGIKYMETGEFGLVRNLCLSRNRLLAAYPSSIREIRFFTAIERGFRRSRTTLYAGAWAYWFIGSCFTHRPRWLSVRDIQREAPEIDAAQGFVGLEYSDGFLIDNDARFVFGFIRAALNRGAVIANYVQSCGSKRDANGRWQTVARDVLTGRTMNIDSRLLINACGPSVDTMNALNTIETQNRHVFSKGVHLVVDRIGASEKVLAFFADDGRLFFVIPMGAKSCIGTTDTRVTYLPPRVTEEDRRFILDNINKRLKLPKPLTERDIIAERCGVRPLVVNREAAVDNAADWTALSRKHALDIDSDRNHVSVFGGKLTDCLNIGEEVVAVARSLGVALPDRTKDWFGEPADVIKREYLERASAMKLDQRADGELLSLRLWRRYGSDALSILEAIARDSDMATPLFADFIRGELHYAAQREMITKLEDFLRRRSCLALTERVESLASDPGLVEACRILFGDRAKAKLDEYFGNEAQAEWMT
ncbi:MAG TPA: FAD-dependent oxidoreductase [Steroidobacteraceae bacterium]|nr:FAD-dependent oxidoreductase [Steroidobacteraceae bacterium]